MCEGEGCHESLVLAPVPRSPPGTVIRSGETSVCARCSSAGFNLLRSALLLTILAVVVHSAVTVNTLSVVRQTCHCICFCYVSAAMCASLKIGASCCVVLGARRMILVLIALLLIALLRDVWNCYLHLHPNLSSDHTITFACLLTHTSSQARVIEGTNSM